MSRKTCTEVVIDGKVYKLGGYEEPEYLQRVAAFINDKISELRSFSDLKRLPSSYQAILVQLNIADEYFKIRKDFEELQLQNEKKEESMYDLKHDLSAAQMKAEKDRQEIQRLTAENEKLRRELDDLLEK